MYSNAHIIHIFFINVNIKAATPGRCAGPPVAYDEPFKVPEPAFLKLDLLDPPKRVQERIDWRNAAKMLKLKG